MKWPQMLDLVVLVVIVALGIVFGLLFGLDQLLFIAGIVILDLLIAVSALAFFLGAKKMAGLIIPLPRWAYLLFLVAVIIVALVYIRIFEPGPPILRF